MEFPEKPLPYESLTEIEYGAPASSSLLNDIFSEADENFNYLNDHVKNLLNQQCPIGSIIGLHPDVDISKVINPEYWKYCDGQGTFQFTYSDETISTELNVPNLTDSRFLMGGKSAETGNCNFFPDHNHECQSSSHSHIMEKKTGTVCDVVTLKSYSTQNSLLSGTEISPQTSTVPPPQGGILLNHKHTLSGKTDPDEHNHTVGAVKELLTSSNLLQYFKVKYYIRIK